MTTQPRRESPALASVGDYTLLSKLGEGGMGVVHLARKHGEGERVALKMLRPHIVGDDEARQRLAREVNSLTRIQSLWVAEIREADPWADVPYVITRYVPGLSLHDQIDAEGPIRGADLLWLAGCLAEGLSAVHEVGVLHRDVKPSNVLMEGRTPILIDFGLARVADDPRLTHTGWLLGTPGYLAPEILYGEDASTASDLHSWAATVAFAGIGRAPFGRGPSMAIMDRVRRGEHDLRGLDGPLREVIAAALDPEPLRRPMLHDVLAWLRPQTTRPQALLAPPPGTKGDGAAADMFTEPLALAALADADRAATAPTEGAAGDDWIGEIVGIDGHSSQSDPPQLAAPTATRVLPQEPPPLPVHVAPMSAPLSAPAGAPPTHREMPAPYPDQLTSVPPYALAPNPWPQPVSAIDRLRRGVLVAAGAVVVGVASAAAPWISAALILVTVWLLRSGSLAASAVGERRRVRGRRWYDGAQFLIRAPWHLVQSIPGSLVLILWSAGLGVAAALLCYALQAGVARTLFVSGLALGVALWWGPGGSRVRGPLNRVLDPASRSIGGWLGALLILLAIGVGLGLRVESNGVAWAPASDRPFPQLSGR